MHTHCDEMTSRTFASSAPSIASEGIRQEFGVSREVSDLITTTFLLGYVFGVCSDPSPNIRFVNPRPSHCSGAQVPKSQVASPFSHWHSPCTPSSTLANLLPRTFKLSL